MQIFFSLQEKLYSHVFINSLSKSDILMSRRGQEHGPLLEANVSAESVHFMQNSSGSRKGILDFITVFG